MMKGIMSIPAEVGAYDQGEAARINSGFSFPELITAARQEEGHYPAFVDWQQPLGEGVCGFIARAPGTLRALAVIEHLDDSTGDSRYLAQTFRARRDAEDTAAYDSVCEQMLEETGAYEADLDAVNDRIRQLYLGYALKLQYSSVILECNDPSRVDAAGDMNNGILGRESQTRNSAEQYDDLDDLAETVEALFDGEKDAIAYDIAKHMAAQAQRIDWGREESATIVYRTRLTNYPWAFKDGLPVVEDFVLLKVNDGSIWYQASVPLGHKINAKNVKNLLDYDNQLLMYDVPEVLRDEITKRVDAARQEGLDTKQWFFPAVTEKDDDTIERIEEIVAYDFLDQ
jgi:hypothetical protein